jgi:serine/threonine protein kinase
VFLRAGSRNTASNQGLLNGFVQKRQAEEGEDYMADTLTKAGRYEVVRELGRGSMGVVYQGYDPVIGRTVAIKTMLTEDLTAQEFQEFKVRFQREAQAAGVLSHPNIVNVFDYGEDNGVLYLIMEYLEGKSLEKLVEGHNILPIETIIPMYDQVCGALDHAHQHGIIHRDIKPANIMILDNGLVKVTDFGIAKMVSMEITHPQQVLGTPKYMSPEQVKGRRVDGRSDIFSLGVILYSLVTGEEPFPGQNITTVIYKIINESPIPPRELDASIHPGLSYVICKALAKSPDERYQTCRELADDLKNFKYLGGPATPSATIVFNVPPPQSTDLERAAVPVESPTPPVAPPEAARIAPAPTYQKPQASPMVRILMPLLGLVTLGILGGAGYLYLHKGKPRVTTPPVGQLYVESNIPGARISVDGQSGPNWVTPHTIPDLSPGAHQVVVSKEGYGNYQQAVTIEGGKTNNIAASLSALPPPPEPLRGAGGTKTASTGTRQNPPPTLKIGQLLVTANVSGAKISVDGSSEPDWVTPHSSTIELAAGTHQVVVSKEGYDDYQQSVTIEGGKTRTLNAPLSAASGEIQIVTTPPGLDVLIDGKLIGPSPARATLRAGDHRYAIRRPGAEPYENTFNLASGAIKQIKVNLGGEAVATGIVDVHTAPIGATVSADGTVEGKTPISFRLPAGRHTLVISLSGFRSVQQEVEVTTNGTIPVNIPLERK